MLTAVHVYNDFGNVLELPLDASSGYVVKSLEGLGPVKADIVTTEYVGMDGGAYQNSKGNMRNIVFQLGFNPMFETDDPFGDLRRGLYPYLTPKMKVEIRFISSNFETVKIIGYVESFEPSIFSSEPEVQISILCPDPYFMSLLPVITFFSEVTSLFNFNVNNPGTVDSGFILTINGISNYTANDVSPFFLIRTAPFADAMGYYGPLYSSGELMTFQIITIKGRKSAKWKLKNDYIPDELFNGTNVLGYMDKWINVIPGLNNFQWAYSGVLGPAEVTLSFTPRYAGL